MKLKIERSLTILYDAILMSEKEPHMVVVRLFLYLVRSYSVLLKQNRSLDFMVIFRIMSSRFSRHEPQAWRAMSRFVP